MKTLKVFSAIALIAMLASFAPFGGEGFTMHVNNKLVIEHYFISITDTPCISMDAATGQSTISISYNECGKVGTNRKLTLKDEAGKVLKEWKFTDSDEINSKMIMEGKEIMEFKKERRKAFTLTYTSKVVSAGRLLAALILDNEAQAASKK
jgi:hypothetical protein